MWERLAALEPADANRGANGVGQLEAGLQDMTAVLEQRSRLQVSSRALLPPGSATAGASRHSGQGALASLGDMSLAPWPPCMQ